MKKILIIDDEKLLLEMYREKFIQSGFEVISAFSGKEALEILKKEKPDLILLDILLPNDTGLVFLKEKNNNPQIAGIPVVAFSNYDDPRTRSDAIELGVKEYLLKTNYTPSEVVAKVKEYLK